MCIDHQSLHSWHKEHVVIPSGHASRRAGWHETLAKVDLTVVYVSGKDNTVADRLNQWAYPASKGMTDISAHGDVDETAGVKNIINLERMTEEDGMKCFKVMAAGAPLSERVSRQLEQSPLRLALVMGGTGSSMSERPRRRSGSAPPP